MATGTPPVGAGSTTTNSTSSRTTRPVAPTLHKNGATKAAPAASSPLSLLTIDSDAFPDALARARCGATLSLVEGDPTRSVRLANFARAHASCESDEPCRAAAPSGSNGKAVRR